MSINLLSVDGHTFEIASDETRLTVEYIHKVWEKAGKPNRLEGESAWKVMDAMMQVWAMAYPWEIQAWKKNLQEEQSFERTPHDVNKAEGGYFPIAYPTRLFQLIKVYFKNDQLADRKLIKKFVKRYPILQITKYNI